MRVSHTKISKYKNCPRMYDLYYNNYIRPDYINSALFFGIAFDEAINVLLLSMKPQLTSKEELLIKQSPHNVFDTHLSNINYNNEIIDLSRSPKARYSNHDFVESILLPKDYELMTAAMVGYIDNDPLKLRNQIIELIIAGKRSDLDKEDLDFLTYTNWIGLRRKGHEMIDSFIAEIYPKIEEVYSIQDTVTLVSDDMHEITGKIDFRAKLVGYEGAATVDTKSSSNKYSKNSVKKSEQLGIYQCYTQDNYCAYAVVIKKPTHIKQKTCLSCQKVFIGGNRQKCDGCKVNLVLEEYDKIETQLIVDKIDPEILGVYFDEISDIIDKIEAKKFPMNLRGGCYYYGTKCPYYRFCRSKGLDTRGLVNLTKEG